MNKKFKIIIISIFVIILLLFIVGIILINKSFDNAIPVLAYHDVLENPTADTDISIDKFEKQMKYLSEHGYKSLTLDEFYEWKKGKKIPGKKVLITFDDGRESFYMTAAPILKKYNLSAVVFAIVERIDNVSGFLTNEQINKLHEEYPNLYIESHSYALHYEDGARSNDYDTYNNDMKLYSDREYKYYAYPFGITNDNYQQALKDNGYKLAFLFSPGKWADRNQNDYAVTRVPVYNSTSFFKFQLKVLLNIK